MLRPIYKAVKTNSLREAQRVRWKVHNQSVWGVAGDDVEVRCSKEGGFSSEGEKGEPKHTPKAEETLTAMEAHKRVHLWVTLGLCLNTMNLVRVRKQVLSIGPMKQPCATVVVRQQQVQTCLTGTSRAKYRVRRWRIISIPLCMCVGRGNCGRRGKPVRDQGRYPRGEQDPYTTGITHLPGSVLILIMLLKVTFFYVIVD